MGSAQPASASSVQSRGTPVRAGSWAASDVTAAIAPASSASRCAMPQSSKSFTPVYTWRRAVQRAVRYSPMSIEA